MHQFNIQFFDFRHPWSICLLQYLPMQPIFSSNTNKNIFTFSLKKDQPLVTVRSNFDSGNINKLEIGLNNCIIISPSNDCQGTEYESHAKGWFHFAASGFSSGTRQKFVVKRMNQLGGQSKFSDYFKPVFKIGQDGQWERIQQCVTFNRQDDTQLHFQFIFQKNMQVFFAYSYPFSYTQCQQLISHIKQDAKSQKSIYFHDDILIQSVEGRSIHLITISSQENKLSSKQSPIDNKLFPSFAHNRAFKFNSSKRVVLISARVHPGQAPSSHTMNGVLKFLISKDARAELLRKNFVFKLIPMLNPDGVYQGNYRMDMLGQNLNRFYIDPEPFKQPSSYALKKLGEYFKLENRLCFFMDLHAHPQKKGNFIYGNNIENIAQQIETQLYPKILSLNCVQFDYQNSCFSKNHMTLKDRNEDFSKQGCSRVVFHRQLGVIYSYTMECGYTASNYFNELSPLTNPHRKVQKLGIIQNQLDNVKSPYYAQDRDKKRNLTIKSYQNLGKSVLISILDLFQLNTYSRLANGNLKTLGDIRSWIGENLAKGSKQYKAYQKPQIQMQMAINIKKLEKEKNQTQALTRSLPKAIIGLFDRKIISSKVLIHKNSRDLQKRRTLPKMKTNK